MPGNWLRDYPWKSAYGPADRPLESFYLPALARSVQYNRIAGFFSSSALAAAAQGVAKLVAQGGWMRLLVGAQLSQPDLDAIMEGISLQDRLETSFLQTLRDPSALADALVRERLKVLAWLVAHDQLEIRVVVEADPQTGQPLASGGYFHAKGGVLWDDAGDAIAFSGSINESETAWRTNYERFHVFCSWQEPEHFQEERETFERIWQRGEAGWLTVDLPEAVRRELLQLAPDEPPTEEPSFKAEVSADANARWLAQYIRDAPYLVHGGWRVGVETAGVEPFPHQRAVAYSILEQFPCRRLLADEVGLGKTIEAGLILRSLLLSGRVKRCLILAPRSLAKQWQEELRDRFLVDAPFYDGNRFVYFQHPQNRYEPAPDGKSPWEAHQVTLASAQMVKRAERTAALLSAQPWDLIILDEAHHARRRDFLERDRPNRLLQLMRQLRERTRAMLLLTATPMQVHPVEVWDLLSLLDLPKAWQDKRAFLTYFQQFHQPYDEIAWEVVLPLLRESIFTWDWNRYWRNGAQRELRMVRYHRLESAILRGNQRDALSLDASQRQWLMEAMRLHNPVQFLIHRNTRNLLRKYFQQGILKQHIPNRRPDPIWLDMSDEEESLYQDIENYISEYYKKYEDVRRGLGFIMTVYRRRLTSSLYALQRSLKRRRQFLLDQWQDADHPAGLDDEDIEEADLSEDASENLGQRPIFWEEEVEEVDQLLEQLARLPGENKFVKVNADLEEALKQWDQVLVFTQYTDTLDFLRQQLIPAFGSRLGCYSGRGGEVWDAATNSWAGISKELIQQKFTEGQVKVLLCTDAAGEGLNLQNCGVIFNYDMPWNPMKVEQRIGRIDRIGQRRPEVSVRHYFYEQTVEAQVYKALDERIGLFETIVGELQPILQQAQEVIKRAAMTSPKERGPLLDQEVRKLEQEVAAIQQHPSPLSQWTPDADPPVPQSPVTSSQLEGVLVNQPLWMEQVIADSKTGLLSLGAGDSKAMITFKPEALEDVNIEGGITFCTYGSHVFDSLMQLPAPTSRGNLLRLMRMDSYPQIGYYAWMDSQWEPVTDLEFLTHILQLESLTEHLDYTVPRVQFEDECKRLQSRNRS